MRGAGRGPPGLRDTVFGATYEVLREVLRRRLAGPNAGADRKRAAEGRLAVFGSDMLAALAATIASGPLNYARNMQFARWVKADVPSVLWRGRWVVVEREGGWVW